MPGEHSQPPGTLAAVMEGSLDVRAAGAGRLTRTANRPQDLTSARRERERTRQDRGPTE